MFHRETVSSYDDTIDLYHTFQREVWARDRENERLARIKPGESCTRYTFLSRSPHNYTQVCKQESEPPTFKDYPSSSLCRDLSQVYFLVSLSLTASSTPFNAGFLFPHRGKRMARFVLTSHSWVLYEEASAKRVQLWNAEIKHVLRLTCCLIYGTILLYLRG